MVSYGQTSADYIAQKERTEIELWRTPGFDSSPSSLIENFLDQAGDARIFWEKLAEHRNYFEGAGRIVEVGAGQGWAACMLKKLWPEKQVYATDIAPGALALTTMWEHTFGVTLDGSCGCRSYEMPFGCDNIDLVFCFQAAHHLVCHRKTLSELWRILRRNGKVLYLHEPGSRPWSYSLARKRLNNKRPGLYEEALVYPKIAHLAKELGFATVVNFVPTVTNKDVMATIYFYLLKKRLLPRTILPCIVDVVLLKEG